LRPRPIIGMAILSACLACTPRYWLTKAGASEETRFAKESIGLLLSGDLEALTPRLAPNLRNESTRATLTRMAKGIPPGQAGEPVLVGYNRISSPRFTQTAVSLQYPFPGSFLLVQANVQSSGGAWSLSGLHIQRLTDSLDRLNAFRLAGKLPRHYVVFAACIVVPSLILFALVRCVRTPIPRRKWLWIVFVLFGVGQAGINWTTGEMGVNPFSLQLFGAGAMAAGPYAPWFLSFSLPVGAMWFLWRRPSLVPAPVRIEEPARGHLEAADERASSAEPHD